MDPPPADHTLSEFYAQFHLGTAEGGSYDDVEERMQADFPAKIQLMRRAAPDGKPGRILDVGCGKGFFLSACVRERLDATGLDLSETAVAYAHDTLNVNAVCGSLHEKKRELGLFDTVTLWATLEHLPRPLEVLRDIWEILVPGGRLLLDTGIGDDWLDRLLPGRVQWYDPPQHLWVYSATGLTKLVEQAGFGEVTIDECFERSPARKLMRLARNGASALGLRLVSEATRLRGGTFEFTRFPLGNLMSVAARKR